MSRIKHLAMVAGSVSVAVGVGFVMQHDGLGPAASAAPSSQVTLVESSPETVPDMQTAVIAAASIGPGEGPALEMPGATGTEEVILPEIADRPEQADSPVMLAALDADPAPITAEIDSELSPEIAQDCHISMTAEIAEAAFARLTVFAPCHQESPLTIHHQGMMFSARTDPTGTMIVDVPALAEVAVFIAAFPDGEGDVATLVVPQFSQFDRAVLQWQGSAAVMLSAYEFGAPFGSEGHVWRDNMQSTQRAVAGDGGFLVQLGDNRVENALMAEIYTFPSGDRVDGEVLLSAEVEITQANCGQDLNAQSIQVYPDGETLALDLSLVMPSCDAVGDVLFLQNMFEDLTLASR